MKILLIRPSIYSAGLAYPGGPRFGVPAGILSLAAVCEQAGHSVNVYDALVDFTWDTVDRNDSGAYHIGASWHRMAETVARRSPDVVGITNPFSDFAHLALRAATEIRSVLPSVPIIAGGPHATVCPEYFLADGSPVDYVVQGEGEQALIDLLFALESGKGAEEVAGVCSRRGAGVRINPHGPFIEDLDVLPLPAYHLVDLERYIALVADGFPSRFGFVYPGSEREISLITSRGCPFHCVFCGNHLHMGRRWRYHSAEYVLRHMKFLIDAYAIRHFHLEDDNISLQPRRFEQLLDGIISAGWDITWDTPNGIRAEGLTDGLIAKIKASGCTYLVIGVESGNQTVLDTIVKKRLNLIDVEQTLSSCDRAGLDAHAFYIIGFPGETRGRIRDTFRFARRMLLHYGSMPHLGLARPLPLTELHEISRKNGYLTAPILPKAGSGMHGEIFKREMIETPEFTPRKLEQWAATFGRQIMILALLQIITWIVLHPRAWPAIIRKVRADRKRRFPSVLRRLFFGGLFYKRNFLKELWSR
jgi:radical SAM superfamily enzyme YgiQ (UPF0313 family)